LILNKYINQKDSLMDIIIHWFRQDLRLSDNPAFHEAANNGRVLPIYILDNINAGNYQMGAASKWWLKQSLGKLNESLNGNLSFYQGDAGHILMDIIHRLNVKAVYWNRCYEPWRIARDAKIKSTLKEKGINVKTYNASLLWEPWEIKKDDGTPYKVFTPFYRKCQSRADYISSPLQTPKGAQYYHDKDGSVKLENINDFAHKKWHEMLDKNWHIGECAAKNQMLKFIDTGLKSYKIGRDFPAKYSVSRLSPHIHFGEISLKQLWHGFMPDMLGDEESDDFAHFQRELGWREFSYHLLYYNPDLPSKNLQTKFDAFPWVDNDILLSAWKRGETGIPLVDAGMRELWQTGYMHNRVRMIVASFLVKNLSIDWRHGAKWFWDTLLDADLANNSASWQWVAGCGADAAPFFRIFNPVAQAQKFDPGGDYIRQFIPEIAALPTKYLSCPWDAPNTVLKQANIRLGITYPRPIVDLKTSRQQALIAYQSIR
jgi:deoxyribodipyrimidine photo-lyase